MTVSRLPYVLGPCFGSLEMFAQWVGDMGCACVVGRDYGWQESRHVCIHERGRAGIWRIGEGGEKDRDNCAFRDLD